jgi:hypothetical protein
MKIFNLFRKFIYIPKTCIAVLFTVKVGLAVWKIFRRGLKSGPRQKVKGRFWDREGKYNFSYGPTMTVYNLYIREVKVTSHDERALKVYWTLLNEF